MERSGKENEKETPSKEETAEERKRTMEWLAEYGQRIADGMFRDAGLFYEEECRGKRRISQIRNRR